MVREKPQNATRLAPVVLIIGILSVQTNKGEIEQEKRTQFPARSTGLWRASPIAGSAHRSIEGHGQR